MSFSDYTGRFRKPCEQCGVVFCSKKHDGPGRWAARRFCSRVCANPTIIATRKARTAIPLLERFWSRVARSPECWEWTGTISSTGYGTIRAEGRRTTGAHRVSWELANGPIPEGICVLHRCDNRKCVRPDHLFLGTRADNNRDREAKGRGRQLKGAAHPRAKVGPDEVRAIRARVAAGESAKALAREFAIGATTVGHIIHRRSWKHIL